LSVERRAPEFEILVSSPEANMMKSAPVVMRIYQRRDCKQPPPTGTVFDAADAASFHLNDSIRGLRVSLTALQISPRLAPCDRRGTAWASWQRPDKSCDQPSAVCTQNLNPNVLTMKSAQYGARNYDAGSLNLARDRRILVQ
jgi:hypothetical protein